ncbi:MAG: spore germination protein [Oscillospiraceae bacterium]|nr:spore germination protein [Oscillospiraceae bacterium]
MDIYESTEKNAEKISEMFSNSFDLTLREFSVNGKKAAAVSLDGMVDEMKVTESIIKPLTDKANFNIFNSTFEQIKKTAFKGVSINEENDLEKLAQSVSDGNLILFLEDCDSAFVFSVQGFPKRGIDVPQSEQNERGSSESFTDNFKDNVSLLRRRLRTPKLIFVQKEIGTISRTNVLFCYLDDRADKEMVKKIEKRLEKTDIDTLLGSGYLAPFLDNRSTSLFSDTGFTERPDMLAAKLTEGRIGIIVDGTPFALIVPYLFIDYFHSLDDYMTNSLYATFIRFLRIACFFISTALPGFFVAICVFHPEVLPSSIMLDIATAEAKTPFSLTFEAVAIHLIYEIVREAGLRMPVAIGHAVSIVGALVVGDAAVTAGFIAAPMLMVVALTAISTAVISKLNDSVALIRFVLTIIGGLTGFFGLFVCIGLLLADICSVNPYGVPFSTPFSPFVKKSWPDAVYKRNSRILARNRERIKELEF